MTCKALWVLIWVATCLLISTADGRKSLFKRAVEAQVAEAKQVPAPAAPAPVAAAPVVPEAPVEPAPVAAAPVVPAPAAAAPAVPAPEPDVEDDADRRADLKDLPNLAKLLAGGDEDGSKFDYEGCKIELSKDFNNINLDLKDEKCQGVMSIPRLFHKLTGKDLNEVKGFAPLKKFNVDKVKLDISTKDVSFSASAKEKFCFLKGSRLKVKEGELALDFNYGEGFAFDDLGVDVAGKIQFGDKSTATLSLSKEKKSPVGKILLQMDSLEVADFVNLLSRKKEEIEEETPASVGTFQSVTLLNPRATGARDAKGNTEIVVTGSATEIPGIGMATIFVLVQTAKGKSSEVGVVAKVNDMKPAVLIKKLVSTLAKTDLENIPIINDLSLNMVIEYSTSDMGIPTDKDLVNILKDVAPQPLVEEGTRIKFKFSFKTLIEKNNVEAPPATNLDAYLNICVRKDDMFFEFGDVEIEIGNIMMAFVPNFASDTFRNVFGNAKVTFTKFKYLYSTNEVDLEIKATDLITLGSGLLTVDAASFAMKRYKKGYWDFSMSSEVKIGEGTLKFDMSRKGDKAQDEDTYKFKGSIDRLSTMDLVKHFDIETTAGKIIKKMSVFNFEIKDVKATAEYNGDGDTDMRITAKAAFFDWTASFEGYIQKSAASDDKNEFAFGFVMSDVSVNDVAKKLLSKDADSKDLVSAEWLSGSVSFVVGVSVNDVSKTSFTTKEIKDALGRMTGPFATPLPPEGGAVFDVDVEVPEDCKEESICAFLKKNLGAGSTLALSGTVSKLGFTLKAAFKANLKITDRFTLKEASLQLKIGGLDAQFAIEGLCEVEIDDSTQEFRAKLSVAATGTFAMTFSKKGELWDEPFGLSYLALGNLEMEVGINVLTLAPDFKLAGELHFGHPGKRIEAKLAGGFKSGVVPGFFVYASFSKLTIRSILEAFNVNTQLPQPVLDSGFPKGLVAGLALPDGEFIESHNVQLNSGFMLKGQFDILGLSMECDIKVNLPTEFHLEAKFDVIEIAGGAIKLSGTSGKKGPHLKIDLEVGKSLKIMIDAYIEVLMIGVGAKINIDDTGFHFEVKGEMCGLFEATLEIKAPYGKLGDVTSDAWKVKSCLSTDVMDKIKGGATENVQEACDLTKELEKECDEVNAESNSWFEKAMSGVNKRQQKLLKLEEKFQKQIRLLEQAKENMDADCVAECEDEKEWVGGFRLKTFHMGSKTVECPYWVEDLHLRDSPYCLADCEAKKMNWVEKKLNKVGGWWDSGKLIKLEKEMKYESKLLKEVEDLLFASKPMVEFAEIATKKVGQVKDVVVDAMEALAKYAADKLFYLKHFCVEANMATASKGLCFMADAEFYIGGRDGKKVVLDNEEVCFDMNWVKKIGKEIAKAAFSGIDTIKEKARKAKEFLTKTGDKAKAIKEEAEDIERRSKCFGSEDPSKRCLEVKKELKKKSHYYRSVDYEDIPDIVVRNDETMQAFRDIFSNDDDDEMITESPEGRGEVEPSFNNLALVNPVDIDPVSLRNADPSHQCRRTQEVMNAYAGIVHSIDMLTGENRKVRKQYKKFIKRQNKKFRALETKIHNNTVTYMMSPESTANAMFYVEKTRAGIAAWKAQYDAQYVLMDKSSLQSWRGYISETVSEKSLDIASFVDILGTASTETAKRMDIPSNGAPGLTQSLAKAQQIVRSLLTNDDATFSSKSASIKSLSNEVMKMTKMKKQMKCFRG